MIIAKSKQVQEMAQTRASDTEQELEEDKLARLYKEIATHGYRVPDYDEVVVELNVIKELFQQVGAKI